MTRNIRLLYYLNFFTDFVLFAPVAIIYFSQVTGSYALGMSVFSIAYIAAAVFEVPTGVVSDVLGRKKTAVLGAICSTICMTFYAIGGSFLMLVLGATFQGASRAFYSGNNDALLHDSLKELGKEDRYHFYLGKTGSMFQVALAISSLLGGFLATRSFALAMWLSVLPQLACIAIALLLVEPKKVTKSETNIYAHLTIAFKEFRRNSRLRLLTMSSVLRFSLGESAFFLRSVFVNSLWPLWAVGVSYTLSFVGGALSYWFSGRLIDKYKPLPILNFEVIYNRAVNLAALVFPSIISPALMATSSLNYGVSTVAESKLLQKEFTQGERATMGSIKSFAGQIAFGVFSFLSGLVADIWGTRVALISIHLLLLLPLIFYKRIYNSEVD